MLRRALFPVLLPVLFLVAATPVAAAERVVLENGLTVLLEARRTAPVVCVGAYVEAGRVYEPESRAGLSHFVEHMMFRATGGRPEGGAEREVWKVGGTFSAYTHDDFTEYRITAPSDRRAAAVDILADLLTSAAFDPSEVEEERRIVIDEILQRSRSPRTWAFEALSGMSFLPHPYGARIAGTVRTVASISREDLLEYYRSHYRPDRTTLVFVGDFETAAVLEEVRAALGDWPSSTVPLPPPPPPPAAFGHYQEAVVRRAGASPTVLASIPLPGYLHSDYLPSRFLRPVLSGWMIQRIVTEESAALTADIYYSEMKDRNRLSISLPLARPEDAARARDALLDLLRMFTEPDFVVASIQEIAANFQAREVLLGEDFDGLATIMGRAAISGYYDGGGRPERLAAEDRYKRVTTEDLRRVARTYFRPENLRILVLLPEGAEGPPPRTDLSGDDPSSGFPPGEPPERIPLQDADGPADAGSPPGRDTDAKRYRTSMGATLLHLEREGAPVVGGAILFPAGSRLDPAGREGLSALTMKALSLDTRDRAGIRWRLFRFGYQSRFEVDRDMAWVTFTVPRGDFREAFHTITEILARPSFSEEAVEEARGMLLREAANTDELVHTFGNARLRQALCRAGTGERTGYAHEPHGTAESLRRITAGELADFYRDHYRISEAAVAIVGDISSRAARGFTDEALSIFDEETATDGEAAVVPHAAPDWPGKLGESRLTHPSGRAYVLLGTRAPALGAPFYEEVCLLRLALGWQVFHEFTDVRSTAYRAGSFFESFSRGGTFALYVETSPERVAETGKVLAEIVRRSVEEGLPEDLVRDSKSAWSGGAAVSRMHSASVAYRLANRELSGLGYDSFEAVVDRLETLDAEDLREACRRLFPGGRCEILVVNGPAPEEGRAAEDRISAPRAR